MDNIKYYDQFNWENLKFSELKDKIKIILSNIPEDTQTILDIGCGNGIITNELGKKYNVTGLDRSKKALSFVKTKRILASSDQIPCSDSSFDMIFSSELLEHLEDNVFYNTIEEIKRLTKRYIFITVPNGENIDKLSVQCPKCKYIFSRSYHLRSFDLSDFYKYFPEYQIIKHIVSGKKVRYYQPFLLKLKHKISPSISWIPYYWIPKNERDTMCPKCEHHFTYKYKFNIFAFICDMINIIISRKKPYWLLVIMEKRI